MRVIGEQWQAIYNEKVKQWIQHKTLGTPDSTLC